MGSWDVQWNHGRRGEPPIQVHHYDADTVILRQSKNTSFEAPFMFLLFGSQRALLLDSGATAEANVFPLRDTVDGLVGEWLAGRGRTGEDYELVIAHTHGHGDHVAGDGQFADRPHTTVVSREVEAVRDFFGFGEQWPDQTVRFDLGGRVLDVIGSPGHHAAAVTIYDPATGMLFTGDTIIPGRLYVADVDAFQKTVERLWAYAENHEVSAVVGCHVEMKSKPGKDFPFGATFQPGERRLELDPAVLGAVRDALADLGGRPGVARRDDFVLYTAMKGGPVLRLVLRGKAAGLFRRYRGPGPASL